MQLSFRHSRQRAFTLIELLVVIAIIALLAAILFPVFSRARENARRSSCASNLKQMGLGILQYTQDFDENYPMAYQQDGFGGPAWTQAVYPYIKSTQLYSCPSNRQNTTLRDAARENYPAIPQSYAGNLRIFRLKDVWAGPENGSSSVSVPIFKVQKPSQKIMVCEDKNNGGSSPFLFSGTMWPGWSPPSSESEFKAYLSVLHLGTVNYLFCDGHVKAMRPVSTMTGINMWGTFSDNSGTGDCGLSDYGEEAYQGINCDEISEGVKRNFGLLEASIQ